MVDRERVMFQMPDGEWIYKKDFILSLVENCYGLLDSTLEAKGSLQRDEMDTLRTSFKMIEKFIWKVCEEPKPKRAKIFMHIGGSQLLYEDYDLEQYEMYEIEQIAKNVEKVRGISTYIERIY